MMVFAPGQRWISTTEPELGLGTVLRLDGRTVQLAFPASGLVRQYATYAAPLARAEFRAGERVAGNGTAFTIERVERDGNVLRYFGGGHTLQEGELDDVQNVSKADARLIGGRVDRNDQFDFRIDALTPSQMRCYRCCRRRTQWRRAASTRAARPSSHGQTGHGRQTARLSAPRSLLADVSYLGKSQALPGT